MSKKIKKQLSDETRYLTNKVDLIRGQGDESMPKIRGYAAKFDILSEFMYGERERIVKGAFDEVLTDDVRALINHEGVPLARSKSNTLELGVDSVGLWYEFTPADTQEARSLISALERGDIDQSSFRFSVYRSGYDYVEGKDGETIREIRKISRLRDVSIVTFPAYPEASAELKRSFDNFKNLTEEDEVDSKPAQALNRALTVLAE